MLITQYYQIQLLRSAVILKWLGVNCPATLGYAACISIYQYVMCAAYLVFIYKSGYISKPWVFHISASLFVTCITFYCKYNCNSNILAFLLISLLELKAQVVFSDHMQSVHLSVRLCLVCKHMFIFYSTTVEIKLCTKYF